MKRLPEKAPEGTRGGTLVYLDEGEIKYVPPRDPMYSTVTFFASHYVDADGNIKPIHDE